MKLFLVLNLNQVLKIFKNQIHSLDGVYLEKVKKILTMRLILNRHLTNLIKLNKEKIIGKAREDFSLQIKEIPQKTTPILPQNQTSSIIMG